MTHLTTNRPLQGDASDNPMVANALNQPVKRVGILGGGTAGSTIAIRLAALGVETYLFEKQSSLIDGPPMLSLIHI